MPTGASRGDLRDQGVMSSTIHFSLITDASLLDVVDDEWREDALPVDGERRRHGPYLSVVSNSCCILMLSPDVVDIPLPEGVQAPGDDSEDAAERQAQQPKKPERWTELGLNTVR